VDLASRRPLAGLIVESGFVTAFRVMTRLPLLPFDKFRNIDKIGQVRCPVLVMHGEADEIVPLWHGQRLFQAAPSPSASSRSPARTTTTSCGWLASAMRGPFGNSRPLLRGR